MYKFIALGDTVTDAFIKLKEAKLGHDEVLGKDTITMTFGDKIPYESVDVVRAVGNSANAAVAVSRLGLASALVSDLGDDDNGRECLESLKGNGVATEFITLHNDMKTNYHYVLLYESDRTILVKHEKYNYHLPEIDEPEWLYLSSLAENTLNYHKEIAGWLEKHPKTRLAFQPGTFQMKFGKDTLKDIYKRTDIFFCNVLEAKRILDLPSVEVRELLNGIALLGPKMVVITDGPAGAYAFDGETVWFAPAYPDEKKPLDRTGAGDAFASTTVAALALGKDLSTALSWGAVNSMSVVQKIGAQAGLLSCQDIEKYLKAAPSNFKIKSFNVSKFF